MNKPRNTNNVIRDREDLFQDFQKHGILKCYSCNFRSQYFMITLQQLITLLTNSGEGNCTIEIEVEKDKIRCNANKLLNNALIKHKKDAPIIFFRCKGIFKKTIEIQIEDSCTAITEKYDLKHYIDPFLLVGRTYIDYFSEKQEVEIYHYDIDNQCFYTSKGKIILGQLLYEMERNNIQLS